MALRPRRLSRMGTALLAAAALAMAGSAAASDSSAHVPIDGTGVSLRVPAGFRVAEDFPGIGRDADLTSVLVTELAVPVSLSRERFDAEGLLAEGVQVHRIDRVPVAEREGWLAHATQEAAGVVFRKWILLFGDDTRSVLLTATTPLDREATHQRALVEVLSSARWSPDARAGADAAPEPASPPFRVEAPAPLVPVEGDANALVLSLAEPPTGRVPPWVSIGASSARTGIRDLAVFARRRLRESVLIEAIEIGSESARELDDMPGHEIRARARDVVTGRDVAVTQILASDGLRYYLLQCVVDAEAPEDFAALCERVAASFARTP